MDHFGQLKKIDDYQFSCGNYPIVFVLILHLSLLSSCSLFSLKSKNQIAAQEHEKIELKDISLLPSTGPYAVGLKKFYFKDSQRPDPYLAQSLPRELMVNVYYPALLGKEEKEAGYLEGKMLAYYQEEVKKGGLDGRIFKTISSGILNEPPLAIHSKLFPVILFSPGGGVVPEFYLNIMRELTSHGFVVVAINHTFNSLISVFPDGTTKSMIPQGQMYMKTHQEAGDDIQDLLIRNYVNDLSQILKSLHVIQEYFHNRLDLSKMGMIGHSLGGKAVTYLCPHTPSCRAGVNMDGALLGGPGGLLQERNFMGMEKKPFLFMVGKGILWIPEKTDSQYKNQKVLDALGQLDQGSISLEEYYQIQSERYQGRIAKVAHLLGPQASLVFFKGAEHMAFSDWRLLHSYLLRKEEHLQLRQLMKQFNTLLVDFFGHHLLQ